METRLNRDICNFLLLQIGRSGAGVSLSGPGGRLLFLLPPHPAHGILHLSLWFLNPLGRAGGEGQLAPFVSQRVFFLDPVFRFRVAWSFFLNSADSDLGPKAGVQKEYYPFMEFARRIIGTLSKKNSQPFHDVESKEKKTYSDVLLLSPRNNRFLGRFCYPHPYYSFGGNLDRLTGSWIAAHAGLPVDQDQLSNTRKSKGAGLFGFWYRF